MSQKIVYRVAVNDPYGVEYTNILTSACSGRQAKLQVLKRRDLPPGALPSDKSRIFVVQESAYQKLIQEQRV